MPKPRKPKLAGATSIASNVELLTFTAPVQLQAAADEGGKKVRTFELVAYTGEPLSQWWSDVPIVVDMATIDAQQRLPVLFNHADYTANGVIGQTSAVNVVNNRLVATGKLMGDSEDLQNVLKLADAGYIWQTSMGADKARTMQRIEPGQSIECNGRTYQGPCVVARGLPLREISFVVLGADKNTAALVASRLRAATFSDWVTALGFVEADLSAQQKAAMQIVYDTMHPADDEETECKKGDPPTGWPSPMPDSDGCGPGGCAGSASDDPPRPDYVPDPANQAKPKSSRNVGTTMPETTATTATTTVNVAEQMRLEAAAELSRISGIRRLCAKHPGLTMEVETAGAKSVVDIEAHSIQAGWDLQRTELELLRAGRNAGTEYGTHGGIAFISRDHERDCTAQALQATLVMKASGSKPIDWSHPAFRSERAMRLPGWMRAGNNDEGRQRMLEAAHRYSGYSAWDIAGEAMRLGGVTAPRDKDGFVRAAFSGGSALTNIFTDSVNAILLASYMTGDDTTRGWTREEDVNDFKTNERLRVDVGDGLAKLPRGSEADHADYTDGLETYKIARYAKQFVVDEQDLIDDNLGAITDTPVDMGQAALRLRPDLVYYIMLSNPSLTKTARQIFNATDGNLLTTASLAASTLRSAVKTMQLFRENSINLNLKPTHLLVPPALRHLGHELINSSQILIAARGVTDTAYERGSSNALLADGLSLVSDARLENGVVDPDSGTSGSGSATSWWLLCAMAHTIVVGFLKGTGRGPSTRSWMLTEGKFGVGWDVKMDIGAKAMDWKGFVKNTA